MISSSSSVAASPESFVWEISAGERGAVIFGRGEIPKAQSGAGVAHDFRLADHGGDGGAHRRAERLPGPQVGLAHERLHAQVHL